MINYIVLTFFVLCFFLSSCGYSYEQPNLSVGRESIVEFNENTKFPYQADEKRKSEILSNYSKIKKGMTGDEVLRIMGNPDDITTLAFVASPARGWAWSYNINKKYERSPFNDINVEFFFDKQGYVDQIFESLQDLKN